MVWSIAAIGSFLATGPAPMSDPVAQGDAIRIIQIMTGATRI